MFWLVFFFANFMHIFVYILTSAPAYVCICVRVFTCTNLEQADPAVEADRPQG